MNHHWVKCNGFPSLTGLLTLILFCLIWNSACSPSPVTSRILFDDNLRLVRLDVTYRTGQEEYAHPAQRSPSEWAATLRELQAVPHGRFPFILGNSTGAAPAFSSKQITWLAPLLSEALSRATPLETAVFVFTEQGAPGLQEITSGGVYAQDHTIHLLVANYRHATSGQTEIRQARNNPLASLGEPLYTLQAGPQGTIETTDTWESVIRNPVHHLVLGNRKDDRSFGTPPQSQGPPLSQTLDPNPSPPTISSHHDTLQMLKKLREQGILTEKEFQEKKQTIEERP